MAPHHHHHGDGGGGGPAVFFSLFRTGVEAVAARLAFFPPSPPTYDVLPAQGASGGGGGPGDDTEDAAGDDDDAARLGRRRRRCRRASNSFFFDARVEEEDRAAAAARDEDGGGDPAEDDAGWPRGSPEHQRHRGLNGRRLEIVPVDPPPGGACPAVPYGQAHVAYVRVPRGLPRGAGGGSTVAGGYDIVVAWLPYFFEEEEEQEEEEQEEEEEAGGGDVELRAPPSTSDDAGGAGSDQGAAPPASSLPAAAPYATTTTTTAPLPKCCRPPSRRRRARCTILLSHGNATDLGRVLPLARDLSRALRCNVVCYDYAGYGRAGGVPGVSNALADAAAALRHARERHGVNEADVVLYGQSIGSGPSVWLAARRSTARLRWRREAERAARRLQREAVREAAAAAGAPGASGGGGGGGGKAGDSGGGRRALSAALSLQSRLGAASGFLQRRGRPSLELYSASSGGGRSSTLLSSGGGSLGFGGGGATTGDDGEEDEGDDGDGGGDGGGGGGGRPPGVAGLILHSPIASGVRALCPGLRHWPAPLDIFPNAHLIRRVTCCPTLVVHGTADSVVDASAGVRLAELCPRPSLPPLFVRGAGHDDLAASPLYLPRLRAFLGECFPDCGDYNDWGGGDARRRPLEKVGQKGTARKQKPSVRRPAY